MCPFLFTTQSYASPTPVIFWQILKNFEIFEGGEEGRENLCVDWWKRLALCRFGGTGEKVVSDREKWG